MKYCHFCKKVTLTPYKLSELKDNGKVDVKYSCEDCFSTWSEKTSPAITWSKTVDLSHINTPEELLNFLIARDDKVDRVCECGMSEEVFDKLGKFGCHKCYEFFGDKMKDLVFPFHKNKEHVGKTPKRTRMEQIMNDPVEKEKLLKLKYAKALELEEYEKCAVLKKELEELKSQLLQSTSSDL
jgi:protein arginine kinase activator